jgi:CRISPR-associated endoribonuclease Cas6
MPNIDFSAVDLAFAVFNFEIRSRDPLFLSDYKGSALRGGFGNALKQLCVRNSKTRTCLHCEINPQCPYAYNFETPRNEATPAPIEAENLPHPFVLLPPLTTRNSIAADETLNFKLTLIGKGIQYLPFYVWAFDVFGDQGIGKGQGRFVLERITDNFSENEIFNSREKSLSAEFSIKKFSDLAAETETWNKDTITLHFITPTEILDRNLHTRRPSFDLLIRSLLRRASLLAELHGNMKWSLDYHALIQYAQENATLVKSELYNSDWERYSNRSEQRIKIMAFGGKIHYQGAIAPFLPLIQLGHYIHIGKKTSFGMGKYDIINPD